MESRIETIGIITAHFLPHLGGVERYTYNLAKGLLKAGKRVIIITSLLNGLPYKEEREGIKIYRLPSFEFMEGRMPVLNLNRHFRREIKEIEKEQIDQLMINTHLYTISCWGSYWGRKNTSKVILLEHGTGHMNFNKKWLNQLGEIYEHILMEWIKKYVSNFYGVSLACNRWLEHFKVKGKGVFYNAVDLAEFEDPVPYYKEKLKIEENKIVISFVGRLVEDKGIKKLCEAFEKLDKTKVSLIIAGDGELYQELKHQYHDIFWLGAIDHKKVICLLNETDIYVLPTDYPEGFSTGVLEAAMCRCCIITTNAGGSKELILDDSYGKILKENSVEELRKELKWLIQNKNQMKEMGIRVQTRVKENFVWEFTVKKVIKELSKSE